MWSAPLETDSSCLVQFFAASGIKDPYQTQLILSGINVIGTFPGLFAVDKMGRRTVLFIGSAIMFSGQVIAGSVNTAREFLFVGFAWHSIRDLRPLIQVPVIPLRARR